MRLSRLIPLALALAVSSAAYAQEWIVFESKEDMFNVNFPMQPTIENFTHVSEYDSKLPARRYTAKQGAQSFIMTVVDMRTTQREPGRHGTELRGSIQWASTAIRKTGTVTMDVYNEIQVVPGQMLQVTLPNGNRNYAGIYLHKRRLYIMEAIVPPNAAPPILYQASLNFLDEMGNQVRYNDNDYSFPDFIPLGNGQIGASTPGGPPVAGRRGGGGGGAAAGGGGGGGGRGAAGGGGN